MLDLIDRNELHPTYLQGTYVGGGIYVGSGYTLDYDEVVNAPTVEAIPIEWVREWYKSRDYLTEGKTAICRMIWDWQVEQTGEEENE